MPCFVVGICVLGVHWDRWLIPALPVTALFAASGAIAVVTRLANARPSGGRPRRSFALGAAATVIALVAVPAGATVRLDRAATDPSTRSAADRWITRHLPADSRIAVEIRGRHED